MLTFILHMSMSNQNQRDKRTWKENIFYFGLYLAVSTHSFHVNIVKLYVNWLRSSHSHHISVVHPLISTVTF